MLRLCHKKLHWYEPIRLPCGRWLGCPTCHKTYQDKWNKNNIKYYKQYGQQHKKQKSLRNHELYVKNRDSVLKRTSKYNQEHKEELKIYHQKHYIENRETILEKNKQYYLGHQEERKSYRMMHKIKISEWGKRNRKEHPDKIAEINAKHRADKIRATPKWLTKEHRLAIRLVYYIRNLLQKFSDERLHVDHIVPLRGKNVSGLHVPWNLQILTETENLKKNNYFESK